jgi:ABC-type protease/lipase transport system fused ATPase/permease subunit
MIAGSILLGKALMPLEMLIGSWKLWLEARKAASACSRPSVARSQPAYLERLPPETVLPACNGQLRARHLGVRPAAGGPVLHNLNFELPAGAMLAVLGESGSGKSTLARVLAGVLAPTHGEVAWTARRCTSTAPQARGQATGYVPQDVLLHSGSIAHNIARQWQSTESADRCAEPGRRQAARRAGAHDLITALPRGYDTLMGLEAGAHGLVRRPAPAHRAGPRALRNASSGMDTPRLIVLDEPNSQLDAQGDAALERCLHGCASSGRRSSPSRTVPT